MADAAVTLSIHVLAKPSALWEALTTPELIEEWVGDDALTVVSSEAGSRIEYRWSRDAGETAVSSLAESHHGCDVTATLDEADAGAWRQKLVDFEAFLDRQDSIE